MYICFTAGSIDLRLESAAIVRVLPEMPLESLSGPMAMGPQFELDTSPNALEPVNHEILEKAKALCLATLDTIKSKQQKNEDYEQEIKLLAFLGFMETDGKKILNVKEGSIVFSVYCPTVTALERLWQQHEAGIMSLIMEELLVTPAMLRKYRAIRIHLDTSIDGNEYHLYRQALAERSGMI